MVNIFGEISTDAALESDDPCIAFQARIFTSKAHQELTNFIVGEAFREDADLQATACGLAIYFLQMHASLVGCNFELLNAEAVKKYFMDLIDADYVQHAKDVALLRSPAKGGA